MACARPFTYNKDLELNQGSFGSVCDGRLTATGEPIVVKFTIAANAFLQNREEYRILQHVQGHPNIIKVYDIIDEHYELAFAMEKAEFSLHDMLQTPRYCRGIPPNALRDLINDIANAFKFLRDKSVVHRDLKPGNILIFPTTTSKSRSEFCFKLCDFGGAKITTANQQLDTLVGSPAYLFPEMAVHLAENRGRPEQWKLKQTYSPAKVDLWCVGVTLYQASTGDYAFSPKTGEAEKLLKGRPKGTIAGKLCQGVCKYATRIMNSDYPEWLILSVSHLISNLLDDPVYDVFFSSAYEIFNMETVKLVQLDKIKISEHANLEHTKNFKNCAYSLHKFLNLSDSVEYLWLGADSLHKSWCSEEVCVAELPKDSCVMWASGSRTVSVEKKNWISEFGERPSHRGDPQFEYNRRKRHLNFGFNALKDSEDIIEMWYLITGIIKKQIHNLRQRCKAMREWAEFGQVCSTYASSFGECILMFGEKNGGANAQNAKRAGQECSVGMDRIDILLNQLDILEKSELIIEEHPILRAIEELEKLSRRSDTVAKTHNFMKHDDENWMRSLCTRCATRRTLVADQVRQQYANRDGILYVIITLIECAIEVDKIRDDNKYTLNLLETSFAASQLMVNGVLAEQNVSSRKMSKSIDMINHTEKFQNYAKEIHILTKQLNEKLRKLSAMHDVTRDNNVRTGDGEKTLTRSEDIPLI